MNGTGTRFLRRDERGIRDLKPALSFAGYLPHYNKVVSTALDVLLSRASVSAFQEPGPNEDQLRLLLEAAVRAPDHGRLRPWQFLVIRGGARLRVSEILVEALKRRDPAATAAQIEKERGKPLRAPLLIVAVAKVQPNHKIPEIEQVLSAGAAAMNILNAAHALGFAVKWVTGPAAYDPSVRSALGLAPQDRIVGFLHVGTAAEKPIETERPDSSEFAVEWTGMSPSNT